MRRRSDVDAIDASKGSRFSAIADTLWIAQDGVRTGIGRALERLWWTVRSWLVWPLRDRAELLGAPARALGFAALILLAAGAGIAGLLWAAPNGSGGKAAPVAATAPAAAQPLGAAAKPKAYPVPTLHGAAPVFKPGAVSGVGTAEPIESAAAASSHGGAASAKISSKPKPSSASTSAADPPAQGPVAGPAAVAVAREFAAAFVVYEVGGVEEPAVRRAFATTAAPELSRALLRQPPRLPASVKVPKARVLNVVPAPSRGGVFPISVSLLRVGTTSELRLEMEKLKGKRWQVTNVLG
jgi:hypothetical protein